MKVSDLNSFFHHLANSIKFDSESDWRKAHDLVDSNFPAEVIAAIPAAAPEVHAVENVVNAIPATETPNA